MKKTLAAIIVSSVASTALAVTPSTDVYIASVGHGQGACIGSVCSQWRTDVWIHNPSSSTTAAVTVYFLARGQANTSPTGKSVTVQPGATAEIKDIVGTGLFNLDPAFGALRLTSNTSVLVTGRIYDANVVTNQGTGTAGQFFAGSPANLSIGAGQSTTLIGLAQDAAGNNRTNFGFVETSGNSATVTVTKVDGSGTTLATKQYTLAAREAIQVPITDVGGALGTNQRLIAAVTAGTGRVLAFGSVLDNHTGDPSTVDMSTAGAGGATSGSFDGVVYSADGSAVDGGVELTIDPSGLSSYTGVASLACGSFSYVVDFFDTPAQAVAIGGDGSFSTQVTLDYTNSTNTGTAFSITWTLSGVLAPTGVLTGTLTSDTSGGTGDDAGCNGTEDRPWRAGWTGQ
jgi:hypothetical protein